MVSLSWTGEYSNSDTGSLSGTGGIFFVICVHEACTARPHENYLTYGF